MRVEFALKLPFPPSVNKLYATVRGRRVLAKVGRDYKHAAFEEFHRQAGAKVLGPLWVSVMAKPPSHRKNGTLDGSARDLNNLWKILLDSLNGLAFEDDSDIHAEAIRWCRDHKGQIVKVPHGELTFRYGPLGVEGVSL